MDCISGRLRIIKPCQGLNQLCVASSVARIGLEALASRVSGCNFATESESPPQLDGIVKAGTGALFFCHRHLSCPSSLRKLGLLRPFQLGRLGSAVAWMDNRWRIGLGKNVLCHCRLPYGSGSTATMALRATCSGIRIKDYKQIIPSMRLRVFLHRRSPPCRQK